MKRPHRGLASALAGVTLFAATACQSPVQLDLAGGTEIEPNSRRPKATATVVACEPFEDKRLDPEVLGLVGGRPFKATEIPLWAFKTVTHLQSPSFSMVTADGTRPARLTLRPRLLKVYVDSIAATKTAVVVMEVVFIEPDGNSATRLYRGQQAGINWGSAEGEVASALQSAIAKCAQQLRLDLEMHAAQLAHKG